jgi:NADH-quinone oxidoreductase subunit I
MAYLIPKPKRTLSEQSFAVEAVKGIAFTLRRFCQNTLGPPEKRKIATIRYPDEVREYPERFRGVHRLTHRADGSPRCVACLCCSTACPAQCIYIEPAEYEPGDPRYGYERYPRVFVIDELRCIFCGLCVEACPCDAIRMDTGMHVPASWSREHFLFDKEMLMSIPGRDGTYVTANPRHEPGDPTYPGIDRAASH